MSDITNPNTARRCDGLWHCSFSPFSPFSAWHGYRSSLSARAINLFRSVAAEPAVQAVHTERAIVAWRRVLSRYRPRIGAGDQTAFHWTVSIHPASALHSLPFTITCDTLPSVLYFIRCSLISAVAAAMSAGVTVTRCQTFSPTGGTFRRFNIAICVDYVVVFTHSQLRTETDHASNLRSLTDPQQMSNDRGADQILGYFPVPVVHCSYSEVSTGNQTALH